jgi:hypothetical protein
VREFIAVRRSNGSDMTSNSTFPTGIPLFEHDCPTGIPLFERDCDVVSPTYD